MEVFALRSGHIWCVCVCVAVLIVCLCEWCCHVVAAANDDVVVL